ncbi:MAG: xanthine dehydrogenase family protein subunit M [Acidimicrobiia bacterium]|nr:xanthine dehydrogenase family protein subunit M [Acidimicrobiia bacterium]
MQSAPFDYYRPGTIGEAVDLLTSIEGARALAGGHSLLPAMKLRVAGPAALVDLSRISGLDRISRNGRSLHLGALATHAAVAASDVVNGDCPVLAHTAAQIGDPQVRNRGTIGGSLAHADPAADYPTVMRALGATIHVTGGGGKERAIPADDFFVGLFATSLQLGELVTAVEVPVMGAGQVGVYSKHRHPASSYAVVGVAAIVTVDGGKCTDAAIGIGGVTGKPERASGAEAALVGSMPTREAAAAAAAAVGADLPSPIGDLYASGEFRVHLASVLTRRALVEAFGSLTA